MEKRISFFEFQSVKSVAKAIDPKLREKVSLQKKALALTEELKAKQKKLEEEIAEKTSKMKAEFDKVEKQISLLEAGIVQTIGFRVYDLVKKVIEPTGKTDPKTGKALTVTKYLPTDIVRYDENTKEYIITVPDETPEEPVAESPTETSTEEVAEAAAEASDGSEGMPWSN